MKLFKTVLCLAMAVMFVIGGVFSVNASTPDADDKTDISELFYYFTKVTADGKNETIAIAETDTNAYIDIERKLSIIEDRNADLGAQMRNIVNFWREVNDPSFTNVYHPNADDTVNTDDMITDLPTDDSLCIFGYGLRMQNDGTMSAEAIARCQTILALAKQYPNAWICVSGGHTAGDQFDSEGGAMKNWLVDHGVNESRIIIDENAMSTVGNITNSFDDSHIGKNASIKNFVTVTSEYHIPRATLFMMTYIYLKGYDKSVAEGGKGYTFCGNLGAYTGYAGYESTKLQASGVGQLIQGVYDLDKSVSVSKTECKATVPDALNLTWAKSTDVTVGTEDISSLITAATATFKNGEDDASNQVVEGFTYDVLDKLEITGYNKNKLGYQEITVSFSYGGGTVSQKKYIRVKDITSDTIIKQAVQYFTMTDKNAKNSTVGEKASADVERKLQELETYDANLGKIWRNVFATWKMLNADGFVNSYHPNEDLTINKDEMIYNMPNDNSVCIFGYGKKMAANGEMDDECLGRCKTILALAQQYPNAWICVSGGHTAGAQYKSEGGAMAEWLIANGVSESRILIDELAMDTVGNITNSFANQIVNHPEIKKFITVTSDYHIPRATLLLLAYIETRGLDYEYVGNLGFAYDPNKTSEAISMQRMSFTSIAGVSIGWSEKDPVASVVDSIIISSKDKAPLQNGATVIDVNGKAGIENQITAYATFTNTDSNQNVTNFKYDVTDKVQITGFDPNVEGEQNVTFTLTYGGVTVTANQTINNVQAVAATGNIIIVNSLIGVSAVSLLGLFWILKKRTQLN